MEREAFLAAALCLATVSVFAQTSIDTAFARKLYSAGHDDLFKVEVGLKNTGSLPGSIDTAETNGFFRRHEIRETPDAKSFIAEPAAYARKYEVYISPTEVIFFMEDTLVERLVDLGAGNTVSLGSPRPHGHGQRKIDPRLLGRWLLGRKNGPRPDAPSGG